MLSAYPTCENCTPAAHPALEGLCLLTRLHQVAAEPHTLRHRLGLSPHDNLTRDDMLRTNLRWDL